MLNAVVLSQFTVSSSRAAKPTVQFGRWYWGQEASTVCGRPFALLLCTCSLPRALSFIYALFFSNASNFFKFKETKNEIKANCKTIHCYCNAQNTLTNFKGGLSLAETLFQKSRDNT